MITFEHRNQKFVIAVAGGGSGFLSNVLQEGGASLWLIHAEIPYSTESFESFVGGVREKIVSESSARQLAVASEAKGNLLGFDCIGVGASCALLKDNERSGRVHRIFVAAKHKEYCVSVEWQGNLGSREGEENLASNLISYLSSGFARYIYNRKHSIVCDFRKTTDVTYIFGAEIRSGLKMNYPSYFAVDAIKGFELDRAAFYNSEVYLNFRNNKNKICIFPGSFSFVHEDHIRVFRKCEEIYGAENCFIELSTNNFKKQRLDSIEVSRRILGMRDITKNIIVTNKAMIRDKVGLLCVGKKVVFAVGEDAFSKVEALSNENISFLVFPRNGKSVDSKEKYFNKLEPESFFQLEGKNLSSSGILKN